MATHMSTILGREGRDRCLWLVEEARYDYLSKWLVSLRTLWDVYAKLGSMRALSTLIHKTAREMEDESWIQDVTQEPFYMLDLYML